jgi:hypothetical protein
MRSAVLDRAASLAARIPALFWSLRSAAERVGFLNVSDWPVARLEPRGDDPKTWLKEPSQNVRWLFKPAKQVELGRLQTVTIDDLSKVVDQVPDLSDLTHTFIVELLRINQGRLLDEC